MKPYTDWPRVRLGVLIGLVYALIINGIGYVLGRNGYNFPGKNLALFMAIALYFAMGWWTARNATTQTEGISQGLSIGLGIGVGALIIGVPLMIYVMGGPSLLSWPVLIVLALFGELKWAIAALLGGRMRASRNTPLP